MREVGGTKTEGNGPEEGRWGETQGEGFNEVCVVREKG